MKKFLLILVVLSLFGCSSPVVEEPDVEPPVLTFEEAVQEVYEMTGRTLFYSLDGVNPLVTFNRATSSNEIPGVCTDYTIEFVYYWNEVKNYDEVYGKAYFAMVASSSSTLNIVTGNFVKNGTSHIREESGKFGVNSNLEEMDGVWRDVIVTSIVYTGKNILHYGRYKTNHMWPVIEIDDDWYDTEPMTWDTSLDNNVPYKITF